MYFPFIRGKQFDLIALREITDIMSANVDFISPIIEPVKDSSTLSTTLSTLVDNEINFNLIINPSVGDLKFSTDRIIDIIRNTLNDYQNYQIAVIIDDNYGDMEYLRLIDQFGIRFNGYSLIHNTLSQNPADLVQVHSQNHGVSNNIIDFQKTSRRYNRSFEANTVVSLEDFFNAKPRNVDYLDFEQSFFSEEHLFFRDENFKGFSDYLTIGEAYSETGFLPYAVAIHLSYADENQRIQIRHFVSDTNIDSSDVGGKFAEALDKLIDWVDTQGLHSRAIEDFRSLHQRGHFPGLGYLKKLSIMHHIELVLGLIS